jgi:hypothetical protein
MRKNPDVQEHQQANGGTTRQSRRVHRQFRLLGPLTLLGLSALALCLVTASSAAAPGPGRYAAHITKTSSPRNGTDTITLAANLTGGVPAGGVLGDVNGDGIDDILAIDPAGNLWLYPNTGSGDATMFAAPRSQVGIGWTGYTMAAVASLYGPAQAGIVAIDPAGNLWYYPNTGGSGLGTFGAPTQIGIGWNGYTVAGIANLNSAPGLGIVAIDPAGNLWYYPGTGGTGMSTFGSRILVGTGWTGYTADVTDFYGNGHSDVLAVDPNGNLWYYPNSYPTGSGTSTFGAPIQVGSGWQGWQAVDFGELNGGGQADIFGIDPSGNLWYYPNTGGTGFGAFGTPIQVGTGWTGYRIN